MNKIPLRSVLILSAILVVAVKVNGQTILPVELTKNTIKEQINYVDEHTRIYENFRAIREDMYQKVNRNIKDSLAADKNRIAALVNSATGLRLITDSLNMVLETTNKSLEEVTSTKNHIKVFGIQINKNIYNTIVFATVAGLIFVLSIGFLAFKRNLIVHISTKKELRALHEEFEAYRQSTRIAREKMAMDHFNEVKKLKGGK
jgi:predicted small metal-binding protein